MILSAKEKKLFFNVGIIIAGIALVGMIYWGISSLITHFENKSIKEKEHIIELYEYKIDSINIINTKLLTDIRVLDQKIDSLEKVKGKIYWNYAEKIKYIYDADAINHAQWMDTIVRKLESNRK